MKELLIKKISDDAVIPFYAKEGDCGLDLFTTEDMKIESFTAQAISTGIQIALPDNCEAMIRPRSGNSLKGVPCLVEGVEGKVNKYIDIKLGTVDTGYRGEIKIITFNPHLEAVTVPKGTKLAQMVINKIERPNIRVVEELEETDRGSNGFGSTGV